MDDQTLAWLHAQAQTLDTRINASAHLLPRLAGAGLLGVGVPADLGGSGGDVGDVAQAVAGVAGQSLTAALALAEQRCFIEVLRASSNLGLRDYRLPAVLDGSQAGAIALPVGGSADPAAQCPVRAHDTGRGWRLSGRLSAIGNLQPEGHLLALPVVFEPGRPAALVLLQSEQDGLHVQPLDEPLALRGACVADLRIEQVYFREDELLHGDAQAVHQAVWPLWLILQAAGALGLAQAALQAASQAAQQVQGAAVLDELRRLAQARRSFLDGLRLVRAFMPLGPLLRWCEYFVAQAKVAVARELASAGQADGSRRGHAERRQREAAWLARRWPTHQFFED